MSDYKIVAVSINASRFKENMTQFIKEVKELQNEGYKPTGGLAVLYINKLVQAMIKQRGVKS